MNFKFEQFGVRTLFGKEDISSKIHWNQRVPEIRKKEKKTKVRGPRKKKRRLIKAEQFDACINPFHYLELSNPNVQPEFTCSCNYRVPTAFIPPLDISTFAKVDVKIEQKNNLASINHKQKLTLPESKVNINASHFEQKYSTNVSITRNTVRVKKSGQISTEHQDRSKRFKQDSQNFPVPAKATFPSR